MAALDRALALAQVHDLTVPVGEHLDLDVTRVVDVALDIHRGVAEGRARLGTRRPQRPRELAGRPNEPHPLAAAAEGRLDHDRIADVGSDADGLGLVVERLVRSRHDWHVHPDGQAAGGHLVSHGPDSGGRWPDEHEAGGGARLRETGVLGEEAVAGVNGLGARGAGSIEDLRDGQIALGCRRRSQPHRLVGQHHVERLPVGLGKDGDGGDAHLAAGADDPNGDLAPIGDEDLPEGRAHGSGMIAGGVTTRQRGSRQRVARARGGGVPALRVDRANLNMVRRDSFAPAASPDALASGTRLPVPGLTLPAKPAIVLPRAAFNSFSGRIVNQTRRRGRPG